MYLNISNLSLNNIIVTLKKNNTYFEWIANSSFFFLICIMNEFKQIAVHKLFSTDVQVNVRIKSL